ncbi:MAG: guanylate kinase [Candidatus Syntrophonatronum acetioxidans]|uniref:Guanylate kinase n=1 Tax=Candidatus Syntrophonatronum acetioxidans TaxID=1795816 RepID=A0A424YHT8_9FIRM|nr:MAG: guanylate kinase [Candidatus Syntrophonatronum acetioxidans]
MTPGLLIILSGPSGTGKGTVCDILSKNNPSLVFSISMTTRPPRPEEKEGKNYFFVTEHKFKKMIEEEAFLEWAKVYGYYYGTPRHNVEINLTEGKDVLLEIDTQGAKKVKSNYSKGVFIFLLPPSLQELRRRIEERGTEDPEKIQERFSAASLEILEVEYYNYLTVNDIPERAAQHIRSIIEAEKCRVNRNKGLIDRLRRGELIQCP